MQSRARDQRPIGANIVACSSVISKAWINPEANGCADQDCAQGDAEVHGWCVEGCARDCRGEPPLTLRDLVVEHSDSQVEMRHLALRCLLYGLAKLPFVLVGRGILKQKEE